MAKQLSKAGILEGLLIEAQHVTQSIDAFSGEEAYDITLSGSYTLTGSMYTTDTVYSNNFQASTALTIVGNSVPDSPLILNKDNNNYISFKPSLGGGNRGYVGFLSSELRLTNNGAGGINLRSNGGDGLLIDSSQNVLIPSGSLTVNDQTNINDKLIVKNGATSQIELHRDGESLLYWYSTNGSSSRSYIGSGAANDHVFRLYNSDDISNVEIYSSGSKAITINKDQKVTLPNGSLAISGSAHAKINLYDQSHNNYINWFYGNGNIRGYLGFTAASTFQFSSSATFKINTPSIISPNANLTLTNGDITLTNGSFNGEGSGSFSGSFFGDGSGLTGTTTEWDGTRDGDAEITGSLTLTDELNFPYDNGSTITYPHIITQGEDVFPLVFKNGMTGQAAKHIYQFRGSGNKTKLSIYEGGKVEIGVSGSNPSGSLEINDSYALGTVPALSSDYSQFSVIKTTTSGEPTHGLIAAPINTGGFMLQNQYLGTYPNEALALLLNPKGGNVGVGTSNPTSRLTVTDEGYSSQIAIKNDRSGSILEWVSGSGDRRAYIGPSVSNTGGGSFQQFTILADYGLGGERIPISMYTGGSESFRIDTDGKAIISGNNPSSIPSLGDSGSQFIVANRSKNYGLQIGVLGSGISYMQSAVIDGSPTTAYQLLLNPRGGNVGVGTVASNLASSFVVDGDVRADSFGTYIDDVYHNRTSVMFPEGGTYSRTGTETGRIAVKLPDFTNVGSNMQSQVRGVIKVQTDSKYRTFDVNFSFYLYASNNGTSVSKRQITWDAVWITGEPGNFDLNFPVMLAIDNSDDRATILIGEDDTSWTRHKIQVTDIQVSPQSNHAVLGALEVWNKGWDVDISALPDTDYNNGYIARRYHNSTSNSNWYRSGTNLLYNTGNVGIGITNPSEKLEIDGTLGFREGASTSHRIFPSTLNFVFKSSGTSTATNSIFEFQGSSSKPKLNIYEGGKVDIGGDQDKPSGSLEIRNVFAPSSPSTLSNNASNFSIFRTNNSGISLYGLISQVLNNGNVYFQAQRVDSTLTAYDILLNPKGGNVGIGTLEPTSKLHIEDADAGGTFKALELHNNTSDTAGTKTRIELPVFNGNGGGVIEEIGNSQDGYRLNIFQSQDSGEMSFGTGGDNERIRIDSTGLVGIGTTDPRTKLHVQGKISGSNLDISGTSEFGDDVTVDGIVSGSDFQYTSNHSTIPGTLLKMSILEGTGYGIGSVNNSIEVGNSTTQIQIGTGSNTKYAAIDFAVPPSGQVLIEVEFDIISSTSTLNSSNYLKFKVGLFDGYWASSPTQYSTIYTIINEDSFKGALQCKAQFYISGLTPGTTKQYWLKAINAISNETVEVYAGKSNNSSNWTSTSQNETRARPLIMKAFDIGGKVEINSTTSLPSFPT